MIRYNNLIEDYILDKVNLKLSKKKILKLSKKKILYVLFILFVAASSATLLGIAGYNKMLLSGKKISEDHINLLQTVKCLKQNIEEMNIEIKQLKEKLISKQ